MPGSGRAAAIGPRAGALLLALSAVAFTLLVAEGALRVRQALISPEARDTGAGERIPEASGASPRVAQARDLVRPGFRGVFEGVPYRTNSRGVRGPEYAPAPPPGTFRIVVLGDSITMGQGVPERAAYPAVSERLLGEHLGDDRRIEVINLGVAGFAMRHSLKRLRRIGLGYRPHLVVLGFTPNDIEGPGYVEADVETRLRAGALVQRFAGSPSLLLRTLWPRLVHAWGAFRPVRGSYVHTLEENYFRNPRALRQITDGLDDLARATRDAGVCGVVFVHTRMNQLLLHPFTRIYDHVAALARERGLHAWQSLPWFRGRRASALRVSAADPHPNAAGHAIHAEALVAGLRALPRHCWDPGKAAP